MTDIPIIILASINIIWLLMYAQIAIEISQDRTQAKDKEPTQWIFRMMVGGACTWFCASTYPVIAVIALAQALACIAIFCTLKYRKVR